jgi:plasmid stabilization system protein ParE
VLIIAFFSQYCIIYAAIYKYHEAAEDELLNEIGHLELRAAGLGRRFFAEVQRAEKLIAQFPESAVEILPGIRKRVLQKFRYSLIYTIEKDGLLILAVAHHSRRPGYWVARL